MNRKQINDYVKEAKGSANPAVLDAMLLKFVDTVNGMTIAKKANFVYEATFTDMDYDSAYRHFSEKQYIIGACSSYRRGDYYGRNYDWHYDNCATFIVKNNSPKAKHKSIGISGGMPSLQEGMFTASEWYDYFDYIPFLMLDGLNDAGVFCNINVVPKGDKGITNNTNPGKVDLPIMMVIRYLLDNADSADHAIALLNDRNIRGLKANEFHFMIGDNSKTYVVEFINNQLKAVESRVMTNFYLDGFDGTKASLTPYGAGFERYQLLKDAVVESVDQMKALLPTTFFTNAYKVTTTPTWFSDYCGEWDGVQITNSSTYDEVMPIIEKQRDAYNHRYRGDGTWQTVHSVVYDLAAKTLTVCAQEDTGIWYNMSLV